MATAPTTPPADGAALPTPPSTSDPTNFDSRGDAFFAALPAFQTEEDALKANVYANATGTYNNAVEVAANTIAVAANSALAAGYAGATVWVSGTTYALYDVRFSPINQRSYRRIIAGAGTTDPSADATNWALIDIVRPIVQVNASTYTAVAGFHYEIIYAGVCTLSLPASPGSGNAVEVTVSNAYDNVLARNGSTIEALSENMDLDVHHLVATYSTSTWRVSL